MRGSFILVVVMIQIENYINKGLRLCIKACAIGMQSAYNYQTMRGRII